MQMKRASYYIAGALLLAGVIGAVLFYRNVVLKELISEFELSPKIADAAGIPPGTSFILKSSANLSATVIKKHLRFSPDVEYAITKTGESSSVFEITPAAALAENTVYSLAIQEGPIAARSYSWAYQVKAPFQITASLPRDQASSVPVNTGIEITFNREQLVSPEDFFEITPPVKGRFEMHRNVFVFVPAGELSPETLYTVTVRKGLRAEGSDDTLAGDVQIRFETSPKYAYQRPYFSFDRRFWEFAPTVEPAFEVNHGWLAAQTVPLAVYTFADLNAYLTAYRSGLQGGLSWTQYHGYTPVTPSAETRVFSSDVPLEEQEHIRFIRMPRTLPEGYYLADVAVNGKHAQAWFQVTPVASFSAVSGAKTALWLKDVTNGKHISGAEILFEGQRVGITGADGVALFDTPAVLVRGRAEPDTYYAPQPLSYFFTVSAGGKQFAVPVEDEYGYRTKITPPDAFWDYFSLDRTIYLPTDTAHFWGVVKPRNGADIRGEEVVIRLTKPYWAGMRTEEVTVYRETKAKISDFYTLTGTFSFSDLRPGMYQVSVKRGNETIVSESLNVETYIKPAYAMTLSPDKTAIFAGDRVTYAVQAKFFDGTPVGGLKVKYEGSLRSTLSGELQLDAEGKGSFSVPTAYWEEKNDRWWPRYLGMRVSPAVAEEGEIDAYATVLVFGPHMHIGVSQNYETKKAVYDLKVREIVLKGMEKGESWWDEQMFLGGPVTGWQVSAAVTEIIYKRTEIGKGYDFINKVTYPIYSDPEIIERFIREDMLATDSAGAVRYEWLPEPQKTYRITFSVKDAFGRTAVVDRYAYGSDSVYRPYSRRAHLKNLDADGEYALGERMHFRIEGEAGPLPPGPGTFMFIRIRNGISSYVSADVPEYEAALESGDVPNVQVMGVWFDGSRFRNTYAMNASFASDERRLRIEVTSDKERYRPREQALLRITVTDKSGAPRQAEVNLAGIDEAVFSLRPEETDIVNRLYQDIYSPVLTRASHITPLGEGAERGGGGGDARVDFRDNALYRSVRTDARGRAEVSFTVPDNLTSWRITAQAVTPDLYAGRSVSFVPVGLPFFVDAAFNRTYLAGDSPIVRVRAFGTEQITGPVTYTIESEALSFKAEQTGTNIAEIPLGAIPPGTHRLRISARFGALSDAIERTITVVNSYFTREASELYELSPELTGIRGAEKGMTALLFSSYERGRFYPLLRSLACQCGARADQKLAAWFAETYLNRFFGEQRSVAEADARRYQTQSGGFALLPYSDADLALSAKFAHLAYDEAAEFDKESLVQYLYASLNDKKADLSRASAALYGLSAFRKPVLIAVQHMKSEQALSLPDKVFLALALDALGAKEEARAYYQSDIKPKLAQQNQRELFVGGLSNADDTRITTALLAGLAASLSEPEADRLGQYAMENEPDETLNHFEMLLYMKQLLPRLKEGSVSFTYSAPGLNGTGTLERGKTLRLELSREQLAALRFSDITGRIGVTSVFEKASAPGEAATDQTIRVTRRYLVDGRETKEFSDGDLVKVELAPVIFGKAGEMYQVVDYLPSGLRAVTHTRYTPYDPTVRHPVLVEDQRVTFVTWAWRASDTFSYYARVVSKGIYTAEPALIQSLKHLENSNISAAASIRIR